MSGSDALAPTGGIDQSGMRRVNTASVLRALAETRETSTMADLVTRTGLSRRTLELILQTLHAEGWVVETEGEPSMTRVGRPKKYYALVADRVLVVSVRIDEHDAEVLVADLRGDERVYAHLDVSSVEIEDVLSTVAAAAADAVARLGGRIDRVRAVAVGVGGTVSDDGVVLTSPLRPEWVGVDLLFPFQRVFDAPVRAENDANLSALAEHWSGAGEGVDTFVMLIPGARLSAGLIVDGAIHRGFEGAAGELIRIRGVDIERWREHPVAAISSPDATEVAPARAILQAARDGDAASLALAREFFASIAGLVSVIGWLLAPPLVVLRASLEGVEPLVLSLMAEELQRVGAPALQVRIARHGARGSVLGGIRLALDEVESSLYSVGQI